LLQRSAMLHFCPLASGSKGNSLYIGSKSTHILIDAGLSVRQLKKRLADIQVTLEEIDAIVVTHEHGDHIKGIKGLGCKMGIPVFANSDTAKAIYENFGQPLKFKIFCTGEPFEYGDFQFVPFGLQHDAVDPVGLTIQTEEWKIGICTDLGFATSLVRAELQNCDLLYVEANHHPHMVHSSNRPIVYKQRVLGRQGHLSNEESADLIASILHPKLQRIYLAHLSSECNTPDLAVEVIKERLRREGYFVPISVAYQDRVSFFFSSSQQVMELV
jgi:phosphoribosyl 1,2-cyclic phosphodiesterase